ncbi:MAG: phosphoribosylformylglycinamidine synthase subunit PurQ [Candidatus Marinimicrobia bacterium]|nr:phosphoribosylformylglycinamidine synthase subunit PurQ [Candidatus Neomarinimicrobiota bacterium]
MTAPNVLILTGYGVNCEAESALAWERAGARPLCLHLKDLLAAPERLLDFGALMFIGGFSYGDHMGSGHVFAQRVRHRLRPQLERFLQDGRLVLGVCNGFQVMTKLGLLPGLDDKHFTPRVTLIHNDCGQFQDRWVELVMDPASPCVFTRGLTRLPLPVRHGEGKFFTRDRDLLERLRRAHLIPCRYADPATGEPTQAFPANPNGALDAAAGLCDPTGRVFGLMPHPEAYLFPENHPRWNHPNARANLPPEGLGLALFRNAAACL